MGGVGIREGGVGERKCGHVYLRVTKGRIEQGGKIWGNMKGRKEKEDLERYKRKDQEGMEE